MRVKFAKAVDMPRPHYSEEGIKSRRGKPSA